MSQVIIIFNISISNSHSIAFASQVTPLNEDKMGLETLQIYTHFEQHIWNAKTVQSASSFFYRKPPTLCLFHTF